MYIAICTATGLLAIGHEEGHCIEISREDVIQLKDFLKCTVLTNIASKDEF